MKPPDELTGVACTRAFCLAVSNRQPYPDNVVSTIYKSTDHGKTWPTSVELEADGAGKRTALGVACDPDGHACYAAGPAGGVWRSTDEAHVKWDPLKVPPGEYRRIACPADETCVAAGGLGTASAAVIKGTTVSSVKPPGQGILGLACDQPTRCTATEGATFTSLNIDTKTWSIAKPFPLGATTVTALACSALDTCTGVQLKEPNAVRTVSLSSSDGGWRTRPITTPNLEAINCVSSDCVAVGKAATWFKSSDAGFDWERVNEVGGFGVIQCSADLNPTCVAGGEKDLGVSRSKGKRWSLMRSGDTDLNIKSVNCTGPSECLFLGKTLTAYATDLRPNANWKVRQPTTHNPAGTDALTCITSSPGHKDDICVGFTEAHKYTTVDGGQTPWDTGFFVPDHASSVACRGGRTSPITCLATGRTHVILIKGSYSDGEVAWERPQYTDGATSGVDGEGETNSLEAVACSPGGDCTAVGTGGVILTHDGKGGYLHGWKEHQIPEGGALTDRPKLNTVTCPEDGVCLAGGKHGKLGIIASTIDDWATYSYDKIKGIEFESSLEAPRILGFGCETVNRCVAVGDTALVGRRRIGLHR